MATSDICFIGSGIAASVTLADLFEKLLAGERETRQLQIDIIEKTHEFWKGIPYGQRSSVNALIITPAYDFINEKEQPAFFEWLKGTKDEWAYWYKEQGGKTAEKWLKNNLPLIENNDWHNLYMPRFLFGNYIKEKVILLIKQVRERGLAKVNLIVAEATEVLRKEQDTFEIMLESGDGATDKIQSHKVVISAGSAPVRTMCDVPKEAALYINEAYTPSMADNIKAISGALTKVAEKQDRNLLVIGSNASSIELLYLLEGLPEIRKTINKIVIISTSGILPHAISTATPDAHPTPAIDKVAASESYTIKTLADAALDDIKLALQGGANMDYVATIVSATLKLMEPLGEQAKKEFFGIHGLRLRDSFRRSGPEYKGGAQVLIDEAQVAIVKGRFEKATASNGGAAVQYHDTELDASCIYPLTFKAIINCSGSEDLDKSPSRLLRNLVKSGLCEMNLSKKGIAVNEKFEAAPGLYVMGPLLGGNMNSRLHFWQLENASRLTYLAPFLAEELLK